MTSRDQPSLGDAERDAIATANPQLKVHISLAERAHNLVGDAVRKAVGTPAASIPPARKVASLLMMQLSNHLRCAIILSVRGYPAQTCVLTASIYEAAFAVMAIAANDKAAESWLAHDDPNRSFQEVTKLTAEGLRNLMLLPQQPKPKSDLTRIVERNYVVYRQLCWPKHLNPMFVQRHSRRDGGRGKLFNGPDTSDEAVKVACFALEHGAILAASAAAVYLTAHVSLDLRPALVEEVNHLHRDLNNLRDDAIKKWGSKNPFAKQWRV